MPITSPPIQNGWVQVGNQQVIAFGSGTPPPISPSLRRFDLGDSALLPQLVNAHTHLEFADIQNPIGAGLPLAQWIGAVVNARNSSGPRDPNQAIRAGIDESTKAGVSLLGDIATPPCLYPNDPGSPTIVSFAEVLGLTERRSEERFTQATKHFGQVDCPAISPHAPYSTPWPLVQRCVDASKIRNIPLAMHVAESADERDLLFRAEGAFAAALEAFGVKPRDIFPWTHAGDYRPLIDLLAGAPRSLLIHGNDLSRAECEHLQRYKHLAVVYCPRTHAFFGYQPHPVADLLSLGVRVALGTDSRASNPDLNLWREIQFLVTQRQDLDPHDVLRMGTVNGADALGNRVHGRIEKGSIAKLGRFATQSSDLAGLFSDLVVQDFRPVCIPAALGT